MLLPHSAAASSSSSSTARTCTLAAQPHTTLGAQSARQLRRCTAFSSKQPDRNISTSDSEHLRTVVLATAVCCAFASNVGAARAENGNWIPRRHHRHIGERFTDTWADSIVEVGTDCKFNAD